MSKIAEFKKDYAQEICDELRGNRFVAVKFDKKTGLMKWYHNALTSQELVFVAHCIIHNEMELCKVTEHKDDE